RLSLACLLCRPRPRSTLFPCPTLFRSGLGGDERLRAVRQERDRSRPTADRDLGGDLVRLHIDDEHLALRLAGDVHEPAVRAEREDRKSTRLNSSHSQISYAVFCLKKKR